MVRPHSVHVTQFVLRRLPAGQFSSVCARLPVRQQEAAGVQHGRVVHAGPHQPVGCGDVRRAGADRRAVCAGPVFGVHVSHDTRHNGPVGAAERAQPIGRLCGQWHTTWHHGHARHLWISVQHVDGVAGRLLPKRRGRANVDGRVARAGSLVTVHAPVRRAGRKRVHPTVTRQHYRPRRKSTLFFFFLIKCNCVHKRKCNILHVHTKVISQTMN